MYAQTLNITSNEPAKINLAGLDVKGLRLFFESIGEPAFRAIQVVKWIHKFQVVDFDAMTDLSKKLREKLKTTCEIVMPTIFKEQVSKDGTYKWLIKVGENNFIETVFIPEDDRGTLCISSQVGCKLNCTFCSTGTQGFNRDLSAAEIIGQVWRATERLKSVSSQQSITNIVFMGMGEPLLNFEEVLPVLNLLREEQAYQLPRRRVTLSTSGLVPFIDKLCNMADVSLAVSLHAPNDKLRDVLVPINKKYPIKMLMAACKNYVAKNHRYRITMEYVMLQGVNDSVTDAKELAKILYEVPCKINLIPFNHFPGSTYQCSSKETIITFREILVNAGYVTTTRKTRGADIDAACGQLVGKVLDKTRRNERYRANLEKMQEERSEDEV